MFNDEVLRQICESFSAVDYNIQLGERIAYPRQIDGEESLLPLFLYPLGQYESGGLQPWLVVRRRKHNAVLNLKIDGVGIWGYGSLLILHELKKNIEAEERRLNNMGPNFSPFVYPQ